MGIAQEASSREKYEAEVPGGPEETIGEISYGSASAWVGDGAWEHAGSESPGFVQSQSWQRWVFPAFSAVRNVPGAAWWDSAAAGLQALPRCPQLRGEQGKVTWR